jgi:geranylgeranyl pyrophosphate synthase
MVQPEDYLRLVLKKTAYSFIHPMRSARLSQMETTGARLLRPVRFLLGAAFQITDDP